MRTLWSKITGTRKRKVTAAVLTAFLVAGVGIAAWTVVTVSGQGNAKIAQLVAPTVANSTTPVADLVPNSSVFTGSLSLRVTNPNTTPLYLKSIGAIDISGGLTVTGGSGACAGWGELAPFLSSKVGTTTGLSIPINGSATSGGVTEVSVPGIFKLTDATPTECQGVVISGAPVPNATFSTAP